MHGGSESTSEMSVNPEAISYRDWGSVAAHCDFQIHHRYPQLRSFILSPTAKSFVLPPKIANAQLHLYLTQGTVISSGCQS
jgi:hypothetical protein